MAETKPGGVPALTVEIKFTDTDIFVEVDGVKIAKRGHKGTRHAKTWVPLEPGWAVRDVGDLEETNQIEIEHHGVMVH